MSVAKAVRVLRPVTTNIVEVSQLESTLKQMFDQAMASRQIAIMKRVADSLRKDKRVKQDIPQHVTEQMQKGMSQQILEIVRHALCPETDTQPKSRSRKCNRCTSSSMINRIPRAHPR